MEAEREAGPVIPPLPGVDDLFGWVVDTAATSVFDGIVAWMARGLAVLIEWVWGTLDTATTPRLTEPWFTTELRGPIGTLALATVVALMLASAIQAALGGRPEQILDACRHAAWSIAATGLSITVIDIALGIVDEASAGLWGTARADLQVLLESVIASMTSGGIAGMGFLAVVMQLLMYLALIGLAVALTMRNALIYVVALLAPLVFASSVLPLFRDSARRVVHLTVALVLSKLAIVATLALAVKMMVNATDLTPTGDQLADGVSSLGTLFAGMVCFAIASITPMVLYKLMPTVEGAVIGAGIASGWGRGVMTAATAATTARNFSTAGATKLATAPLPAGGPSGGTGSTGPSTGSSGPASPGTAPLTMSPAAGGARPSGSAPGHSAAPAAPSAGAGSVAAPGASPTPSGVAGTSRPAGPGGADPEVRSAAGRHQSAHRPSGSPPSNSEPASSSGPSLATGRLPLGDGE